MDKVVVMGGAGGSGVETLVKDAFKAVLPVREISQSLGILFLDAATPEGGGGVSRPIQKGGEL